MSKIISDNHKSARNSSGKSRMKDAPGGVIAKMTRKSGAAPSGPNYHGKRK